MNKKRISLDLPDISDFQPRATSPGTNEGEIKKVAEQNGFTTRHAKTATGPVAPGFDARSLRRTNRTAKLNIATTEQNRERFWSLAQRMGIRSGDSLLSAMMDVYEREKGREADQ